VAILEVVVGDEMPDRRLRPSAAVGVLMSVVIIAASALSTRLCRRGREVVRGRSLIEGGRVDVVLV
jgi:hypothetical protein